MKGWHKVTRLINADSEKRCLKYDCYNGAVLSVCPVCWIS